MVHRGSGKGENGKFVFNGYRVSVGNHEKVLGMDGVIVVQQCEYV